MIDGVSLQWPVSPERNYFKWRFDLNKFQINYFGIGRTCLADEIPHVVLQVSKIEILHVKNICEAWWRSNG